ncbi:MAG: hypothetical protein AB7G11_17690 [Phycisphaerales bacterium]
MSMNIARRVEKLERHAPVSGGCAYCRGEETRRTVMVVNGVETGQLLPPRCATCERDVVIRGIILDGCDDEQVRVARALAAGPATAA